MRGMAGHHNWPTLALRRDRREITLKLSAKLGRRPEGVEMTSASAFIGARAGVGVMGA